MLSDTQEMMLCPQGLRLWSNINTCSGELKKMNMKAEKNLR